MTDAAEADDYDADVAPEEVDETEPDDGDTTPDFFLQPTRYRDHVLQRTIVLPDVKVLFLPIPKTGCTSVLWLLAHVAGLDPEAFTDSATSEVTSVLSIHDMSVWGPVHQLGRLPEDERERALHEDGWLRFALVRHPATRLWSAWQSKLLLREPRFLVDFGEQPWFPHVPRHPAEVLEDFRRFVAAAGGDGAEDVHWAVQRELTATLPLNHIGRMEALDETLALLDAHLPPHARTSEVGRENRAPLPRPSDVYDDASAARVNDVFSDDFEAFGYDRVEPATEPDTTWAEQAEPLLPLMRTIIGRHERIGALSRVAQTARREASRVRPLEGRVARLEARLEKALTKPVKRAKAKAAVVNQEGIEDFAINWRWASPEPLEPGFTAVVRVKNEAAALPYVLPPLLEAVRQVIVVDNESTDGTPEVAQQIAAANGASGRLDVLTYPFSVSRCGPEHLDTPADSVHSLTYFYNWAFSHVATTYALKWDGDMVLTESGVAALRDLVWQTELGEFIVMMPRYPLYVVDPSTAYLDATVMNREFWGWPNRKGYEHTKAFEWEILAFPLSRPKIALPDWSCIELKHLDVDEFAHWSHDDFTATTRTRRKKRELEVFSALAGRNGTPYGLVRIDAPAGEDVIDYVRTRWIPQEKPELRELNRKLQLGLAIRGG
jgi:hypothetical protein